MNMKAIGQAAAVLAFGWAMLATAPVLAGMPIGQAALISPPQSFEAGKDPDDLIADRFWSSLDVNLAIKFSLTDGAEPDNVDVTIKDSTGKDRVDTRTDSALMFTKLPEGNYSIEATWRGRTIKREVTLSSLAQSKLAITWDDEGASTDLPIVPN